MSTDPYGITAEDLAQVERSGAYAYQSGKSQASCDYYPGTTLHAAFQRGWTQAAARASRNVSN